MVYFSLFYGLMTIIGGVIGYLKVGSMMSLISGSAFGLLILTAAILVLKGKMVGYYGLLAFSGILAVFFGMRYFKSFAMMPAGVMLLLSILTLVGLLVKKPQIPSGI